MWAGVTGRAVAGRGSCASVAGHRRGEAMRGLSCDARRPPAVVLRASSLEQADADVGEPGEPIVLLLGQMRQVPLTARSTAEESFRCAE